MNKVYRRRRLQTELFWQHICAVSNVVMISSLQRKKAGFGIRGYSAGVLGNRGASRQYLTVFLHSLQTLPADDHHPHAGVILRRQYPLRDSEQHHSACRPDQSRLYLRAGDPDISSFSRDAAPVVYPSLRALQQEEGQYCSAHRE